MQRFIKVEKISDPIESITNKDVWVRIITGRIYNSDFPKHGYESQISMHYSNEDDARDAQIGDKVNF